MRSFPWGASGQNQTHDNYCSPLCFYGTIFFRFHIWVRSHRVPPPHFVWLISLSAMPSNFMHLTANGRNFLTADQYFLVCIHHLFFTHSSSDGQLGSCHVLATTNSAAVNTGCRYFLRIRISLLLGRHPGVRLLNPMGAGTWPDGET